LRGVLIHMWERGWLFLKKAGTIILGMSILLWAATTFPRLPDNLKDRFEDERSKILASALAETEKAEKLGLIDNAEAEAALKHSVAGRIGQTLEPLFTPLGFDWKLVTPVIGAIAAKEIFVAQLGIIYSVGEADEESESLRSKLQARYSPLTGFCIMLFMLVVAPCLATFAVMKSESGSWRWALYQFWGLTVLAWVLTMAVYQVGSRLGIGVG
ncbi:MAG TPA: ferrous iron transporter B, partial [Desulfobacterales bacterium]|nr:ferrous iron transporter B [Desulfobacterales bacterium]